MLKKITYKLHKLVLQTQHLKEKYKHLYKSHLKIICYQFNYISPNIIGFESVYLFKFYTETLEFAIELSLLFNLKLFDKPNV